MKTARVVLGAGCLIEGIVVIRSEFYCLRICVYQVKDNV